MIATQMGTNFYLIALPSVANYFNQPSSLILNTVYYYLIPYGLFQLFIAPFVNSIGFKRTALWGFFTFALGAIIILCASNIFVFSIGRVIQGVGGSTAYVMIRMIIQRKYKADQTNIAFSILESFAMATPGIAPLLGAYILQFFPWQGLFYFILAYVAFAVFMVTKMLDNTGLQPPPRLQKILSNYKELILNFNYLRFLFVILFAISPTIFSLSNIPFILHESFGLSIIIYSICMSLTICGSFFGTIFSRIANENGFKNKAIKLAIFIMIFSGSLLAMATWLELHSVLFFMLAVIAIFFSFGVIFPNAVADSFKQIKNKTGAEVALLGCFQVSGGAILNFVLGMFLTNPEVLLPLLFVVSGISIGLFYKFDKKP